MWYMWDKGYIYISPAELDYDPKITLKFKSIKKK